MLLPDWPLPAQGPALGIDCMGLGSAGLLEPPLWGGAAPGPIGTPRVLAEHGCSQSHPGEGPVGATTLSPLGGSPLGGRHQLSLSDSSTAPPAGCRCASPSTGMNLGVIKYISLLQLTSKIHHFLHLCIQAKNLHSTGHTCLSPTEIAALFRSATSKYSLHLSLHPNSGSY